MPDTIQARKAKPAIRVAQREAVIARLRSHADEIRENLGVHVSTNDGFRPHQLDRVLREAVNVL